ncbi:MAG: phosphodiester glycosidase family protein [Anaerolineales bacterium]
MPCTPHRPPRINSRPHLQQWRNPIKPDHSQTAQGEGWTTLQPGLERRLIQIKNDQGQPVETLHLWRLDQNEFHLDVAFSSTPKSLQTWQQQTNASMVVNGGYFSIMSEVYTADGLTVLNGRASGHSFTSGGMLAINERGAELRWLNQRPYDPSETLQAALQTFPMLVTPGGQLGFGAERDNHVSARRTVIAQDRAGRILFILAPDGYFTLHNLSAYLTASDLELDIALNLDGGGSTGLLIADPHEEIPSKVLLPFVILVYQR